MDINQRAEAFIRLGIFLEQYLSGKRNEGFEQFHSELDTIIQNNFHYNGWFTEQNVKRSIAGIAAMLNSEDLLKFAKEAESGNGKKVAVIMAGNIPAVGFHDLLCVLLAGNRILIKYSSDDHLLIPFFVKLLIRIEPGFKDRIEFAEGKLREFDAIIATGNNNSAKYFEYYFSKYPNLIRKNRNSAAILTGNESAEQLTELGKDIFYYFGLGCRNVSKLFLPEGYEFGNFFKAMYEYRDAAAHKKYFNNYEYHRALFLLEKINFLDNNFMIVRESGQLSSPVAVLHYEFYKNGLELKTRVEQIADQLQCLVGEKVDLDTVPFGKSQLPSLSDFADRANTFDFLKRLG